MRMKPFAGEVTQPMQLSSLRPTCFFTLSDSHCSFWIIRFSSAISLWLFLRSSQNLPLLLWSSSSYCMGRG